MRKEKLNMKKQVVFLAVLGLFMAVMAEDGFNTELGHGWRLTIGPQFNFNAKGRLGVRSGAIPVPSSSASNTRDAARAGADGLSIGSGRTDFPNGAYIDPNDSAGIAGETWNWHVPAGAINGGRMSFASAYYEQSTTYSALHGGQNKDDANSVGANFGLDRTLWKCGDFGVDIGFTFSFFVRDNWFKGQAGGYTRTDVYTEGAYVTDIDVGNADVFSDPWAQNPDGSYGVGTFDGPGPVLNLGDISVSRRAEETSTRTTSSSYGLFSIRGDMQMYEFQLALKPFYELTDWFMVRGTVGVGLDYRNFDVKVTGHGKDSERDWDCYMVCGLGGMLHWKNICLGADFLRKVLDDDVDVNTRYVNGSIANANWTCRVYVGYEF